MDRAICRLKKVSFVDRGVRQDLRALADCDGLLNTESNCCRLANRKGQPSELEWRDATGHDL